MSKKGKRKASLKTEVKHGAQFLKIKFVLACKKHQVEVDFMYPDGVERQYFAKGMVDTYKEKYENTICENNDCKIGAAYNNFLKPPIIKTKK